VPYGTLVPAGSKTAWVAGRCFSATHDAHASCRSMAQTMSMGQAAGLAVIQSLEKDCGAKDIDVARLRDELTALGQMLAIPNHPADTSRDGWKNNLVNDKK
ncbi:MAG: FAD-dependent oxidoreductase, partial [Paludibacter sp.]